MPAIWLTLMKRIQRDKSVFLKFTYICVEAANILEYINIKLTLTCSNTTLIPHLKIDIDIYSWWHHIPLKPLVVQFLVLLHFLVMNQLLHWILWYCCHKLLLLVLFRQLPPIRHHFPKVVKSLVCQKVTDYWYWQKKNIRCLPLKVTQIMSVQHLIGNIIIKTVLLKGFGKASGVLSYTWS